MITISDVACQIGEAIKVLSGPSHPVSKVSKADEILKGLRAELYGYEACNPCKPCPPCEPEPDCDDEDDDGCDEETHVWVMVPKDYAITLSPCV